MISVSFLNPQPPGVADTVTMSYDGLSRRVSIVESHGATVINSRAFVWAGKELCEERNSAGQVVNKRFLVGGEQILTGNNPGDYFYTVDLLGSVRGMSDTTGVLRAVYDYDPWGRPTKISGDLECDFGFTGFYVEKNANLDLTWFRAYDVKKGRWLSRDPAGDFETTNFYEYVEENPINSFDEYGLASCNCTYSISKQTLKCTTPNSNPKKKPETVYKGPAASGDCANSGTSTNCNNPDSGGPAPIGAYTMLPPEVVPNSNYKRIPLAPNFPTKRVGLQIHVGNDPNGTACSSSTGCIVPMDNSGKPDQWGLRHITRVCTDGGTLVVTN